MTTVPRVKRRMLYYNQIVDENFQKVGVNNHTHTHTRVIIYSNSNYMVSNLPKM